MLKATHEVQVTTPRHCPSDIDRIVGAICGEAGVINRTFNFATDPLDEMLRAARTWIDVSWPQLQAPIIVGRGGSHVWIHHVLLNRRLAIITDESQRRA